VPVTSWRSSTGRVDEAGPAFTSTSSARRFRASEMRPSSRRPRRPAPGAGRRGRLQPRHVFRFPPAGPRISGQGPPGAAHVLLSLRAPRPCTRATDRHANVSVAREIARPLGVRFYPYYEGRDAAANTIALLSDRREGGFTGGGPPVAAAWATWARRQRGSAAR